MNILVIGKAKTGTTVISQTIRNSLDREAHYVFEPASEADITNPHGHPHVVVKILYDHWRRQPNQLRRIIDGSPMPFDKRIVLLRDPRDEMISYMLYYAFSLRNHVQGNERFNEWIHFLRQKEQAPADISFISVCRKLDALFATAFTASLTKHNTLDGGYTRFRHQLQCGHMVFKYEDFIERNSRMLEKYLGLSLSDDRTVDARCSQVYRTGSCNNWKRYFTEEDVAFFKNHRGYMDMLGYTDWTLTPVETIPDTELSGYVIDLLTRPLN